VGESIFSLLDRLWAFIAIQQFTAFKFAAIIVGDGVIPNQKRRALLRIIAMSDRDCLNHVRRRRLPAANRDAACVNRIFQRPDKSVSRKRHL